MPAAERTVRKILNPVTSPPTRRVLVSARDAVVGGVASVRSHLGERLAPSFVVVGAQKAGTTFLHQELVRHPDVVPPLTKEIHFFDDHYDRGYDWYLGHFRPWTDTGTVTGESSPGYMFHPRAVARLAAHLPTARVIVLLRDPVRRAYSHFLHERRLGFEQEEDFGRALDAEDSRIGEDLARQADDPSFVSRAVRHFSYRARGEYLAQILRCEAALGDRLLVIESEHLFADPRRVLDDVQRHVGLRPWQPDQVGPNDMVSQGPPLDTGLARELTEYYRPFDEALASHLGRTPRWRL